MTDDAEEGSSGAGSDGLVVMWPDIDYVLDEGEDEDDGIVDDDAEFERARQLYGLLMALQGEGVVLTSRGFAFHGEADDDDDDDDDGGRPGGFGGGSGGGSGRGGME